MQQLFFCNLQSRKTDTKQSDTRYFSGLWKHWNRWVNLIYSQPVKTHTGTQPHKYCKMPESKLNQHWETSQQHATVLRTCCFVVGSGVGNPPSTPPLHRLMTEWPLDTMFLCNQQRHQSVTIEETPGTNTVPATASECCLGGDEMEGRGVSRCGRRDSDRERESQRDSNRWLSVRGEPEMKEGKETRRRRGTL